MWDWKQIEVFNNTKFLSKLSERICEIKKKKKKNDKYGYEIF